MNLLAFLNTKFEKFTQGQMSIVIKDGKLQLKELEKVSISREILFSKLRKKNIYQLGEIKRVYVESCGLMSIYKNKSTKPGLGILPYKDQNIWNEYQSKNGLFACTSCGNTIEDLITPTHKCEYCGSQEWILAVN
jgi:uncharacterized membrane protein YcaP (DUF421 family)